MVDRLSKAIEKNYNANRVANVQMSSSLSNVIQFLSTMKQSNLKQIVDQLETLNQEELKQLNQIIQQFLIQTETVNRNHNFHQSLLDTGLVKQIKHPVYATLSERQLIQVEGKPVSETIIEERR